MRKSRGCYSVKYSKDRVIVAWVIFIQYQTGRDKRTDRQTESIIASTALLNKLCWRAV